MNKELPLHDRDGVIWFDGKFVPWREAKVHVLTHTLHYGVGVFEGLRAYETEQGPAIFRLQDHTERFFGSAKIIQMPLPFTAEQLNQAQLEILQQNKLRSAYIRPMAFYGSEVLGIYPRATVHIMIAAWEWDAYFGDTEKGIKVHTSSFTRHHVNSTGTKAKINGNYVNSALAVQEARALGCSEALLLDTQGFVAEGSGANVFIVRKGKIYTPHAANILEGITRETIMTLAADMDMPVTETNLTRDMVYTAEEVFFTGTAIEVVSATLIDNRVIGDGEVGPITRRLTEAYHAVVSSKEAKYRKWLTWIK